MKILVTGGAGYLGGAVTELLKGSGHEVTVYDLLLYEDAYRKEVPFVYGDVRDAVKLRKCLEGTDLVIWLAALVGDPACGLNEQLTKDINTESVRWLVKHFKGRIIFMSTCSVYGAAEGELDEESALNPLSLYACTKLASEKILKDSGALVFRLGTLFGISDTYSRIRFDLVVNTLAMRAIFHNRIGVFGGDQFRPLLHVRDAAKAIISSIGKKNEGIYNLHCENTTIYDIAERMKRHFPGLEVETSDVMFQDNRNYRVSSEKAHDELGFKPSLTIDDGIAELKETLQAGRVKNSFISRFSNYLYLKPLVSEYSSPLGKVIKLNI